VSVGRFELSILHVPEVVAALRHEMAELLRHAAADEPRAVADRLIEVAATFEVGATLEVDDASEGT
jgi:hypothetical protein